MKLKLTISLILFCRILIAQALQDSSIVVANYYIDYGINDYMLMDSQEAQLDSFIKTINLSQAHFQLNGFADNQGLDNYNYKLSEKRNIKVRNYLISRQVSPESILINSHGENNIENNETSEVIRQQNRRVSIKVSQPQQYKLFTGYMTTEDSLTRISGDISVYIGQDKKILATDSSGNFILKIPIGIPTELYFTSTGHYHHTKKINLTKESKTNEVLVSLHKIELGRKMKTTLEFVRGKSILLKESESELDALFELMTKNADMCIELRGHVYARKTISLDSSSVKFGLSIARSLEIYNYLKNRGIAEHRMVANGYGNSKLLYPNAQTKKEMSANRRVEIQKLKCDYVSTIANPILENLESYRTIEDFPLGRTYNESTIDEDLKVEGKTIISQIKRQATKLIRDERNPGNFTYLQLFEMYRNEKMENSR